MVTATANCATISGHSSHRFFAVANAVSAAITPVNMTSNRTCTPEWRPTLDDVGQEPERPKQAENGGEQDGS